MLDRLDGERDLLRPLVRAVDAELVATAMSLRRVSLWHTSAQVAEILTVSSAARQYDYAR